MIRRVNYAKRKPGGKQVVEAVFKRKLLENVRELTMNDVLTQDDVNRILCICLDSVKRYNKPEEEIHYLERSIEEMDELIEKIIAHVIQETHFVSIDMLKLVMGGRCGEDATDPHYARGVYDAITAIRFFKSGTGKLASRGEDEG